jgi:hypothetical protein
MSPIDCDQFHEITPDLALGLLAGHDRGAALNHLVACSRCRRQLESLVQVADDLLLLAPAVEPEIGFESRVMARLAADGAFTSPSTAPPATDAEATTDRPQPPAEATADRPAPAGAAATERPVPVPEVAADGAVAIAGATPARRPLRGRRAPRPTRPTAEPERRWGGPILVGAAAALIVVAGVSGLIAGATRGRNSAVGEQAQAANQLAARTVVIRADAGRSTCQLVAFPAEAAQPARIVVSLDEPGDPPSSYQVLAERTDGGPAVMVGTIAMADGHGMLAASIPAGTGPVDAVRIIEGPHTVRYRATFASV